MEITEALHIMNIFDVSYVQGLRLDPVEQEFFLRI
jgi:hypothetical protein